MAHPTYTAQQLQRETRERLKVIYTQIGSTVKVTDKRYKHSWIQAILLHQSAQLQKVNEQATVQAELEQHIATQANAIAPEPLTTVEISFYDHEIYSGNHLIASITHDDDLTQPWVVIVEGVEKFRANTWGRCYRFIQWHLNNSQLPSRNSQLNSIPKSREFASLMNQSPDRIDNCELRTALAQR
ncbi:MAG: hypothetical protein KME21_11845 [Desmonostoc vinosum HA7617-LM4]|jgi:hypothetical protein|nr:hypothetical protein [Desmonostoc vinosum HA7617-LM4]